MPYRIGLTGGIGSGKTTVSRFFEELGVPVIDADIIAHDAVKQGKPAYHAILKAFGQDIIAKNGELRRDYLRKQVFTDNTLKIKLENILHPIIYDEMNQAINKIEQPYCIISIPLLAENSAYDKLDRILVVDTDEASQVERTCQRDNLSKEQVEKILASQTKRESRKKIADDIIENNQDLEYLKTQVHTLHQMYLKLAEEHSCHTS